MTPWVLTRLRIYPTPTSATVVAQTNTKDHLFMMWNYFPPIRKPIYKTIRGKTLLCGYKYAWANPYIIEQAESGNTIEHTFFRDDLIPRSTIWFYVWAPLRARYKNIQGPLMNFTLPPTPPAETIFETEAHIYWVEIRRSGGTYCRFARKFSPEFPAYLTSATVWLTGFGQNPEVIARMQLRADDNGQPSDDIIETSPTLVTTVAPDWTSYTFNFIENTLLDPDTPYWMVVYRTDSLMTYIYCRAEQTLNRPGCVWAPWVTEWFFIKRNMDILIKGTRAPGPPPYDLEIGSPAIDQIYYWPAGDTVIDSSPLRDPDGNPPAHGGTIDKVEIFATEPLSGVRVGTFARLGNQFTSRDHAVIGDVAGGSKQAFTGLNIVVEPGDCLGIYYSSGDFDVGRTADHSIFYASGNLFDTQPHIYREFTPWAASICGYGWVFP